MIFSDEHIEALRNYDFYKKDRLDGMNDGLRTVKVWGDHADKPPFVSVVVTTYKRPQLLKLALESTMRQKFRDYEIIVVDNECADIAIETDTQRLIKGIDNPQIVYFRNLDPMNGRMDRGASLARGEWICFLHDDDMLATNHMETMTSIVKNHPEINFLSCEYRVFREADFEKIKSNGFIANNRHDGRCREVCLEEGVFFHQGPWTGALIKRKLYEEMGGMPYIETGCSDQIMLNKLMYWYSGFYKIRVPFYFYRISDSQIAANKDNWFNTYISDYFFSRYALTKLKKLPKFDQKQLCLAFVWESMNHTEELWEIKFNFQQYAKKCGIDKVEDNTEVMQRYIKSWGEYERQVIKDNEKKEFDIYINDVARISY